MAEAWPIFELNAGDLELAGNKELSRKSLVYGATLEPNCQAKLSHMGDRPLPICWRP